MMVPQTPVTTLFAWRNATLEEGDFYHHEAFPMPGDGRLVATLELKEWPQHYGLELFVLSPEDYARFELGHSFTTYWRDTIVSRGLHESLNMVSIPADTSIVVVVDNSDLGWHQTDMDNFEDTAVFDFHLGMIPE
jgi:hypothetical protein